MQEWELFSGETVRGQPVGGLWIVGGVSDDRA